MIRKVSFGLLFPLLCSCNNYDKGQHFSFAISPIENVKYYYTIKNEKISTFEVENKKVVSENKSTVGFIYELTQDTSNNYRVKLTYDQFYIVMINNGKEQIIDASKTGDEAEQIDKLLADILGSSIIVTINSKGGIIDVEGKNAIRDKVLAGLTTYNSGEKKQVEELINQLTGESFFNNNLQDNFNLLPDSLIKKGDSWNRVVKQTGEIMFEANNKYTLIDVENGFAEIDFNSTIKKIENGDNSIMEHMRDFKGNQSGTYIIFEKSGLLNKAATKSNFTGVVRVMGRDVPVSIKVKREINVKKI